MLRRRRQPRVVLWGGRRRDIQLGTFADKIHVMLGRYRLSVLSGLRSHHDHVHVATSDHFRGTFDLRVEPGSISREGHAVCTCRTQPLGVKMCPAHGVRRA